jgi:hypothetical protein
MAILTDFGIFGVADRGGGFGIGITGGGGSMVVGCGGGGDVAAILIFIFPFCVIAIFTEPSSVFLNSTFPNNKGS